LGIKVAGTNFSNKKIGAEAPIKVVSTYNATAVSAEAVAVSTQVESTDTEVESTVASDDSVEVLQATNTVAKATIAKNTDFFMFLFMFVDF
jgi:hypothetical protein